MFASATLVVLLPLFATRYLPLQDLPQHVAAVRVIADYRSAALGFERFFELTLGSTQYLSVYLASALLAKIFGAILAVKIVIAAALGALPYALRALLRRLRKPESTALLVLPLAYNAHLVLGFLNFLAALPLLFWGIATCLRLRARVVRRDVVLLAVLALACFYTHVVPFGMLVIAALVTLVRGRSRRALAPLVALAPAMLAAFVWLFQNPAGHALSALVLGRKTPEGEPQFSSIAQSLRELPEWFIDVFHGSDDDRVFVAWLLVMTALFVVGSASARTAARPLASARARYAWLVPLAFLGYWVLPASYGFMWPINARFPWLALLLAIPAAPRVSRGFRLAVAGAAVVLACASAQLAWRAFRGAGDLEYAGLSQLVARVPEGSRVAGLIYARTSRFVRFAPYLHSVAWVQAERGGAVEFTFAEFPHSPFRFRDSERPRTIFPRWEWVPERVDPVADLGWFDYVMTRGALGLPGFRLVLREGDWALWQR